MTEQPQDVRLMRRTRADQLRYLASKLTDGVPSEAVAAGVALALEGIAREIEPGPAVAEGEALRLGAGTCESCGLPVLAARSRNDPGLALLFDPVPDGDGGHYDTVLTADLSAVLGSGDATAANCKGRMPLYRAHPWSCPERTRCADGTYGRWHPEGPSS